MFYKPTFCCHCGEKIDRVQPSFFDSSRFCDVCKHDFVPQRALPVAAASLMLLIGLFGIGSALSPRERPSIISRPNASPTGAARTGAPINVNRADNRPSKSLVPTQLPSDVPDDSPMCGATTKKGTPCTRRVRGGGRCWQHRGLPEAANVQN